MTDPKRLKPPPPVRKSNRSVAIPPAIGPVDPHRTEREVEGTDPLLRKTRADFRIEEFKKTIAQKGYFLMWRKAMLCPCFDKSTEQARMNCFTCDGSGFYYIQPNRIQGIITNVGRRTKGTQERAGLWLSSERASVTVLPEYRLHFRDSLELLDTVMSFNELIEKGNRHGIRSKLPSNHDSTRYRIVNLIHMLYEDPTKPGSHISLEVDVDFTISPEGWIKWTTIGSGKVANGTILSVLYEFHPVFVVDSHPHAFRDTVDMKKSPIQVVRALPIQADIALDFLLDINAPVTDVPPTTPT